MTESEHIGSGPKIPYRRDKALRACGDEQFIIITGVPFCSVIHLLRPGIQFRHSLSRDLPDIVLREEIIRNEVQPVRVALMA